MVIHDSDTTSSTSSLTSNHNKYSTSLFQLPYSPYTAGKEMLSGKTIAQSDNNTLFPQSDDTFSTSFSES